MTSTHRILSSLVLASAFGISAVSAQAPGQEGIPNWPAPPFWSATQAAQTPVEPRDPRARWAAIHAESVAGVPTAPLTLIGINPCRIVDTRDGTKPAGYGPPSLSQGVSRNFTLTGQCGIAGTAQAVSLNITVTNTLGPGFISIYPQGGVAPVVSTLNYVAGQTVANAAVVPLGTGGGITVIAGVSGTDLIIDTNGYYEGSGPQPSLSRRASLDQFWTSQNATVLGLTTVGTSPELLKADGADIWVANLGGTVSRVRASDGKLLDTWSSATMATGVLVAMGRILVTGFTSPGNLYLIDPTQVGGPVVSAASNLGNTPRGIAFDGTHVWTANYNNGAGGGSVSIVTPAPTTPWTVTTVTTGFAAPVGALYDGTNVWVTDNNAGTLLKLSSAGAILQTVTVGAFPQFPIFDGTNIWVPNFGSASVTVVQASTGTVLQTLTANGLSGPVSAAFDGERILVTNFGGSTVSLWKAASLAPLGSFATGSSSVPNGACSDGLNFWIALNGTGKLARF